MKAYSCFLHLLLVLIAKISNDRCKVVEALNTTDNYENVEKLINSRHSILKQIARSKVEGFDRGYCDTSNFVVITKGQYGERKCLQ